MGQGIVGRARWDPERAQGSIHVPSSLQISAREVAPRNSLTSLRFAMVADPGFAVKKSSMSTLESLSSDTLCSKPSLNGPTSYCWPGRTSHGRTVISFESSLCLLTLRSSKLLFVFSLCSKQRSSSLFSFPFQPL